MSSGPSNQLHPSIVAAFQAQPFSGLLRAPADHHLGVDSAEWAPVHAAVEAVRAGAVTAQDKVAADQQAITMLMQWRRLLVQPHMAATHSMTAAERGIAAVFCMQVADHYAKRSELYVSTFPN